MRTTLDIDDDVLRAAKEQARREKRSAGAVISDLVRQALTATPDHTGVREPRSHYGFTPFPKRGKLVTNDLIDRLREDDDY